MQHVTLETAHFRAFARVAIYSVQHICNTRRHLRWQSTVGWLVATRLLAGLSMRFNLKRIGLLLGKIHPPRHLLIALKNRSGHRRSSLTHAGKIYPIMLIGVTPNPRCKHWPTPAKRKPAPTWGQPMTSPEENLAADILRGANQIAEYLGFPRRTVYHAVAKGHLPAFRIGDILCARRSTLTAWISQQEQQARAAA